MSAITRFSNPVELFHSWETEGTSTVPQKSYAPPADAKPAPVSTPPAPSRLSAASLRVSARREKGKRRPPHRRSEQRPNAIGPTQPWPDLRSFKKNEPALTGSPSQRASGALTKTAPSQRRDAVDGVVASRAETKVVAPQVQPRRSPRARDRRPSGKERGESGSGSARKRCALRSAQRGTERVLQNLPLI